MHWNMECMMHHIPASAVTPRGRPCRMALVPILFSISCISYPAALTRGRGNLWNLHCCCWKMQILPFLMWHGSCIITASWSLDLRLLTVTKHTVRCSWWHELIEDDRLGRDCWQRGEGTRTHAHMLAGRAPAWLSEILVAQQGGCRESWSVALLLQKCLQVKVQRALEAHAWSAFCGETLRCLPDSFECMLLEKEHLNRTL